MSIKEKLINTKYFLEWAKEDTINELQFRIHYLKNKNQFYRLKQLENMYTGKRCFLIATGPSLKIEDVEKLKNEYTFAVNSFVLALKDISFLPNFYGFIDGNHMKQYGEEILSSGIEHIFYTVRDDLDEKDYKKLQALSNTYEVPQKKTGRMISHAPKMPGGFSRDISKRVFWGYTVTYTMLQIIMYMGFSEIYLLGADCIYRPGERSFHDCRPEEQIKNGMFIGKNGAVDEYMKAYEIAKRYAEKHNIKIYNATRGGMLEIFERVDLDEILEKK